MVVPPPLKIIAHPTAIGGRGTRSGVAESVTADGDGATV